MIPELSFYILLNLPAQLYMMLLLASGIDANGQILPLAWALVPTGAY
jgi:hypothetical protein